MLNQPNIVVATDFSECSDHAIRAGEKIRELSKGALKIVHVASFLGEWDRFNSDLTGSNLPSTFKDDMTQDLKKRLEQQVSNCKAQAEAELIFGSPWKALKAYAKKEKSDLILVGHRGAGATPEFLGSVTSKLISTSDIPVMVINRPLEISKVAGLVEATRPLEQTFSATEEIGYLFNAQIEFISVLQDIGAIGLGNLPIKSKSYTRLTEEEIEEVKGEMEKCIRLYMDPRSKAKVRTEVSPEIVSATLKRILDDEGVDLAVLSRNQRNLIEKVFIGSVARRLLETYSGNLLVLPPGEQQ